jgi:hypothetical protein
MRRENHEAPHYVISCSPPVTSSVLGPNIFITQWDYFAKYKAAGQKKVLWRISG